MAVSVTGRDARADGRQDYDVRQGSQNRPQHSQNVQALDARRWRRALRRRGRGSRLEKFPSLARAKLPFTFAAATARNL